MLSSLSNTYSNFSFEIVLSKPDKNWAGKGGHATFAIVQKAKKLDRQTTGIYLSGSREFVKESTERLDKEKFPLKKIYFEACY
jgi:NAD(P)H-flavin reductase